MKSKCYYAELSKGIICAELGDLICARNEWVHLVQVPPDYTPARVNLEILNSSHRPLALSTSSVPHRNGFALAH
jgi:hypothetical protein